MQPSKKYNLTYLFVKNSLLYSLIIAVISILLVFTTPLLASLDKTIDVAVTVNDVFSKLPVDFLKPFQDFLNTVVTQSATLLPILLITIGIVIMLFVFIGTILIQLIIKKVSKSEKNSQKSSLVRRIVIVALLLINIRFLFWILFNNVILAFIGPTWLFSILLILLVVMQVAGLIYLLIDTYNRIKNNEYARDLFLVEILKAVVIIVAIIFTLYFIKDLALYITLHIALTSINFYDLVQADVLYSYLADLLNNLIADSPSEVSKYLDLIISPANEKLLNIFLESTINTAIKNYSISFIDTAILPNVYTTAIGAVTAYVFFGITKKLENNLTEKILVIVYLVVGAILSFELLNKQAIILAVPFAIIIILFLLVHVYQFVVKFQLLDKINFNKRSSTDPEVDMSKVQEYENEEQDYLNNTKQSTDENDELMSTSNDDSLINEEKNNLSQDFDKIKDSVSSFFHKKKNQEDSTLDSTEEETPKDEVESKDEIESKDEVESKDDTESKDEIESKDEVESKDDSN